MESAKLDGVTLIVFAGGFMLGLATVGAVSTWLSLRKNGKYYPYELSWRR
jgi:C4-dicarboxylate transporter